MEISTTLIFDDDFFSPLERDPLEIVDEPMDENYKTSNSSIPISFFVSTRNDNKVMSITRLDHIEEENLTDEQDNQTELFSQDYNIPYLKCTVCEAMFFNFSSFKRHLLSSHMSKTDNGYACSYCNYTDAEGRQLVDHLLTHKSQCELCHCDLSSDNNFYTHWNMGMTDLIILRNCKGAFVCPLCELMFEVLSSLEKHWFKHSCQEYGTFRCKDCNKLYKKTDDHFCFCCSGCKEIFDSFHQLRAHAVCHKHTLKCPICNYDFVLRRDHDHHMGLHRQIFFSVPNSLHCLTSDDGKIFQCNICGKIYSSLPHLVQHLKLKHPIKF